MSEDLNAREPPITDTLGRPISREVAEGLETLRGRVRPGLVAAEVWQDLFADRDRELLGGDLDECWRRLGTAGMWMHVRSVSLEQALVDIADVLELASKKLLRNLRRALDLYDSDAPASQILPVWDPRRGELRFDGRLIRKARVMQRPSNIYRILDAFQASGWPSRIENPLKHGQQQLHDTLRSLNGPLVVIRFHAQEGGRAVIWVLAELPVKSQSVALDVVQAR